MREFILQGAYIIRYFIPENPDDRLIHAATEALSANHLIAFQTDTNWVLCAGLNSKKGIETLYALKGTDHKKHFSLLCRSISEASEYAMIYDSAFRIIKSLLPGPYTLIFTPTKRLPRGIRDYTKDKEIGIRIPHSLITSRLIETYGAPLISTSIHPHWLFPDEEMNKKELYSYEIEEYFGHKIAMVLDGGSTELLGDSTVIDFSHNEGPIILRFGAGDLSLFNT